VHLTGFFEPETENGDSEDEEALGSHFKALAHKAHKAEVESDSDEAPKHPAKVHPKKPEAHKPAH